MSTKSIIGIALFTLASSGAIIFAMNQSPPASYQSPPGMSHEPYLYFTYVRATHDKAAQRVSGTVRITNTNPSYVGSGSMQMNVSADSTSTPTARAATFNGSSSVTIPFDLPVSGQRDWSANAAFIDGNGVAHAVRLFRRNTL